MASSATLGEASSWVCHILPAMRGVNRCAIQHNSLLPKVGQSLRQVFAWCPTASRPSGSDKRSYVLRPFMATFRSGATHNVGKTLCWSGLRGRLAYAIFTQLGA
jgi:hypothetical protein